MDVKFDHSSYEPSCFTNQKKQILQRADLSRKGAIDAPIRTLVTDINSCEEFVTTSSCSGRIILYCENSVHRKNLCEWLFTSHEEIGNDELIKSIDASLGHNVLKFEPMILHVQCMSLASAKKLHTFALEAGFKNSGLTLGKHGKITLAVRSCLGLEVPLTSDGLLLVSHEYLCLLVKKANEKFLENRARTEKFHKVFSRGFLENSEESSILKENL